MKKKLYTLIILILLMAVMGCSRVTGEDTRNIKAPTNNLLNIYGTWQIKSIKVFDEDINVFKDIDSVIGKNIDVSSDSVDLIDNIYMEPSYKLKVVNKDYILSYESNLTIKSFMDGKEKLDVISIISNNTIVSEFILLEKDKGYIVYMGSLIEVDKINSDTTSNKYSNKNESTVKDNEDINYYNSDTGVMLALKTPRIEKNDGSFTREKYRTLWISLKEGKLMPIIEKQNIIFPRINGMWTLENRTLENGEHYQEYFEVNSLESKYTIKYEPKESNKIYKNINFIGNNYIGIEEYNGEGFNNVFNNYEVLPVDNINSDSGLNIDELYSKDIINKYEMEYKNALSNIDLDSETNISNINYSNFTVKRKDGKWEIVGNLGDINKSGQNEEYLLNLRPNSKMLNYDSLIIPWKVLKGDIPFIRDAYISPNQRIAIILFEDNLAVYEIGDKTLKGAPLVNINIQNEQVIMSEWSTGGYVEKWSKAFNDGINITN